MALTFNLSRPIALDKRSVELNVANKPGVYVLGEPHPNGGVYVRYVGRSDDSLADRLRSHELIRTYPTFVFAYAIDANRAYCMECEMFHEWPQSLKNQIHPARPQGSRIRCPKPGCTV